MYHPLSLAAVSFHFTQNLNIEYRRLLACEERERERETVSFSALYTPKYLVPYESIDYCSISTTASSDSTTHRPIGPSLTYTVALCQEV